MMWGEKWGVGKQNLSQIFLGHVGKNIHNIVFFHMNLTLSIL